MSLTTKNTVQEVDLSEAINDGVLGHDHKRHTLEKESCITFTIEDQNSQEFRMSFETDRKPSDSPENYPEEPKCRKLSLSHETAEGFRWEVSTEPAAPDASSGDFVSLRYNGDELCQLKAELWDFIIDLINGMSYEDLIEDGEFHLPCELEKNYRNIVLKKVEQLKQLFKASTEAELCPDCLFPDLISLKDITSDKPNDGQESFTLIFRLHNASSLGVGFTKQANSSIYRLSFMSWSTIHESFKYFSHALGAITESFTLYGEDFYVKPQLSEIKTVLDLSCPSSNPTMALQETKLEVSIPADALANALIIAQMSKEQR